MMTAAWSDAFVAIMAVSPLVVLGAGLWIVWLLLAEDDMPLYFSRVLPIRRAQAFGKLTDDADTEIIYLPSPLSKRGTMAQTYVRPGTTSEERFQRLQQRSVKFKARRRKGGRGDQDRQAVRESREAA
jgi:hypothetical protein